jgi:hypothetical protein
VIVGRCIEIAYSNFSLFMMTIPHTNKVGIFLVGNMVRDGIDFYREEIMNP